MPKKDTAGLALRIGRQTEVFALHCIPWPEDLVGEPGFDSKPPVLCAPTHDLQSPVLVATASVDGLGRRFWTRYHSA